MARTAEALIEHRHTRWRQTPETHIVGDEDAPALIDRLGIVTLYPASPEVPNLYHAYVGDPNAKTEAKWDSPSGTVYSWRWTLGRKEAAFYAVLVRKRPTFVSWEMLPVALRLFADLRMPDELYDLGVISASAYRIAQALEASGGVLSTGALRDATGFPAGRDQRAAYLKAMEELDTRLLVARFFAKGDDDAHHALVYMRYREYVDAAEKLTREQALDHLLRTYLANAAYAAPHRSRPPPTVGGSRTAGRPGPLGRGGSSRERALLPGYKGECFVWTGDPS